MTTHYCALVNNSGMLVSYCRTRWHNISHVVRVDVSQTRTIVVDDIVKTISRPNNLDTCTASFVMVLLVVLYCNTTVLSVIHAKQPATSLSDRNFPHHMLHSDSYWHYYRHRTAIVILPDFFLRATDNFIHKCHSFECFHLLLLVVSM